MTGGFWAGAIPPWAYVTFAAACLLFLCVGELDGWRRGEREAREDESYEQAARVDEARRRGDVTFTWPSGATTTVDRQARVIGQTPPPEVAHDWPAHVEQALAVAAPDTRSDEEWMADEFAKLHAFMDTMLDTHPATEEL